MRPAPYAPLIREYLTRLGEPADAADPRHIEAYMRLGHSTLDGLSPVEFLFEVEVALECVRLSSPRDNEILARSYGF